MAVSALQNKILETNTLILVQHISQPDLIVCFAPASAPGCLDMHKFTWFWLVYLIINLLNGIRMGVGPKLSVTESKLDIINGSIFFAIVKTWNSFRYNIYGQKTQPQGHLTHYQNAIRAISL